MKTLTPEDKGKLKAALVAAYDQLQLALMHVQNLEWLEQQIQTRPKETSHGRADDSESEQHG